MGIEERGAIPLAAALGLIGCTGEIGDRDAFAGARQHAGGDKVYGVDVSFWSEELTDAEVACFWDEGVRHVIVGTQSPRIARQQLAMAYAGGMTVDLYVYLNWERDVVAEVQAALALANEFPVGRLWLDAEDEPDGRNADELATQLQQALDACGAFPCGIYTAEWWWTPAMDGSTAFASHPLWYAHYDDNPSVATWPGQSFGGWSEPAGKQFNETYVCGVHLDVNTIERLTAPPPPPELPDPPAGKPPAPTGLYPSAGLQIFAERFRMMCDSIPGTTRYEFELQHDAGGTFQTYFTYTSSENARQVNPVYDDRFYRWRVRAQNVHGTGPWSAWATLEFGEASGTPPEEEPPVEEPPAEDPPEEPPPDDPPPDDPPPVGDGPPPVGLSPNDGADLPGPSVTLSCGAVAGATAYAFEVEREYGASFIDYQTYSSGVASKTFWPAVSGTYRWRVRAEADGTWSSSSGWHTFTF
jgi:hypothetical protein